MNLFFFLILAILPSLIMSTPSICYPKLTRQVCPVCAKFIEIHSNLLAQNNAIRVKSACMTLVQANCCSGIKLATKKSTNTKGSRERFASLPFSLIWKFLWKSRRLVLTFSFVNSAVITQINKPVDNLENRWSSIWTFKHCQCCIDYYNN